MPSGKSRNNEVEHKVHPKFEEFVIGNEWQNHDEAFFTAKKIGFARGAYWFWLFSEVNNSESRKVCVYISRMGKKHDFNGKYVAGKNHSDQEFQGAACCWIYENRTVTPIFHGLCEASVKEGRIQAKLLDSNHTIDCSGSFPNYKLTMGENGSEMASFRFTGSPFSGSLQPNEFLKMRSKQMVADQQDGFAKIDRVSQFPYCASNMADLFTSYEGHYQDWNMTGKVWMERARSFGIVANWKLLLSYFSSGSRLWFRRFTGHKLTYQEPMSFYLDYAVNGSWERYPFYEFDWSYYSDMERNGKHSSVGETTRYLELKGSGPKGEIEVLFSYDDTFLARYTSSKFQVRYYQLAFALESLKLTTSDGRVITDKELGDSVVYGEETYKRKWQDTLGLSPEELAQKYITHDLNH